MYVKALSYLLIAIISRYTTRMIKKITKSKGTKNKILE